MSSRRESQPREPQSPHIIVGGMVEERTQVRPGVFEDGVQIRVLELREAHHRLSGEFHPLIGVDAGWACPCDVASPGPTCSTRAPASVAGSQNPTVVWWLSYCPSK